MRYLLDEDLSTDISAIAGGLGVEIDSAQEPGRREWTDEQHLEQAALEGRCIVTGNRDDFRRLTIEFSLSNRPHAGVLVVPKSLRDHGSVAVARALAAFERERGTFPAEYLFDFLQPARD
jgi:predicted nuclease of predicted toxin-antitoxin system